MLNAGNARHTEREREREGYRASDCVGVQNKNTLAIAAASGTTEHTQR